MIFLQRIWLTTTMASNLISFLGKTAIVTGAGGGLGRTYALELAKRGCNVVVNDLGGDISGQTANSVRGDSPALKVVREIEAFGGQAVANNLNILDADGIISHAFDAFGSCDILVNNAGILRDKSFHKMTADEWSAVIDVHLNGTFKMCHALWPKLQTNKYGRIINIGSTSGLYGNFGQVNYGAAKMGIVGLTSSLAREGEKYNICVNCVVPVAASRMTTGLFPAEVNEKLKPEHVAPMVAYLAHDSHKINGEIFEVGGGWYSRVRLARSPGVHLSSDDEIASVESIRDAITGIRDFSHGSSFPTSNIDGLDKMLSSSRENMLDKASSSKVSAPNTDKTALKSEEIFAKMAKKIELDTIIAATLSKSINAKVQYNIGDIASKVYMRRWLLDFSLSGAPSIRVIEEDEVDPNIRIGSVPNVSVCISCSDDTFVSLSHKQSSPEIAYMRGLLKIKGDINIAMKMKSLLDFANV